MKWKRIDYPTFYGRRKMRTYLKNRLGHRVNRKWVQCLMRKMGPVSIASKPNISRKTSEHKVYL
jgi:hypothetical protein